ncbi:alpha/beta hydrolase [Candidatus Dojkabacteria bacterium]|nr:alpha/beta hydrolase [Candidatus Dojkabacteria bacterium]
MIFEFKGLNVQYDVFGQGERLILIHGWGGPEPWAQYVPDLVSMGLQVFVISLPGFGGSDIPGEIIDSEYYAELVQKFLEELEIERPIILGHSLGGKVALILQAKYHLAKELVLTGSAGYKRFYLGVTLKVILAKIGKFILGLLGGFGRNVARREKFLSLIASEDELQSGEMKESFRKIISEDIRHILKEIKIPTLLIWGDADSQTPLIDGVEMSREIEGSKLKIIKGAGHFAFMDYPEIFFKLVKEFIENNRNS